ncbi:nuclear transport factor 2 family protein [Rhizomonospora bruguierae]|uniref:nuclear transport factor 2 family protein n=1 Tax=Rhizomonospora bruguierae TaxID=1581705 RepID=UPI001BCDEF8F|nr:nuclear transport factor 2 family protein [Micromonospora sp. NBRC 107566]
MTTRLTAVQIEQRIRDYMDACTAGDAADIARYFEPDAVHYFPPGMYEGPFRGAEAIALRWARAVEQNRSAWTVDAVVVDEARQQAACEWTHFKQRQGVVLRGCEWYVFSPRGLISEIRAYYAAPQDGSITRLELGGYDYAGRGYPMIAPGASA